MPPLPVLSGEDCVGALLRVGQAVARQRGSHVRLSHPTRQPGTVPLHPELDRGTLRSILRTAGISPTELLALL